MKAICTLFYCVIAPFWIMGQKGNKDIQQVDPAFDRLGKEFFSSFSKELEDSIPSIGSFLIWHNDKLLYENYFNGSDTSSVFNIKSATKNILSALIGIAYDKKIIHDLNVPALDVLSVYSQKRATSDNVWMYGVLNEIDSLRNLVTLKHLLTMRSGFQWNESGVLLRAFVTSSDPVRFVLDQPFESVPGKNFRYSSGDAAILCAVLQKKIKTDLYACADSLLFQPIGMSNVIWNKDPAGHYIGGSEMFMKARDMLQFGLLYLKQGKFNGTQVVSAKWVEESTAEQVVLNEWDVLPGANGYGYFWWRRKINGFQAYVASGYGGQIICIIPEMEMVFVVTCHLNDKNRGRSEIKRIHQLIDKVIYACTN